MQVWYQKRYNIVFLAYFACPAGKAFREHVLKPVTVFHMIIIYKYAYIWKYEERLLRIRSDLQFSAAKCMADML